MANTEIATRVPLRDQRVTAKQFAAELLTALELPTDSCAGVSIDLQPGGPAMVSVKYMLRQSHAAGVVNVLSNYMVVEVEDVIPPDEDDSETML